MKSRLIDAAAFIIGVIAAFMQGGGVADFAWPVRLALSLLGPGYLVGLPLLYLVSAIGLGSFGFFFLVGILVNGLIFGLTSYLIRKALRGQRVARIALAIGMATWIIWGAVDTIQAWPWPERHAPVDIKSPLAGRWNGVLHAPRGDRFVNLVCHPHTDGTLDGYLYVHGWDMGPFESGVYAGDSLHFEIVGFEYNAHFDRTTMTLVTTVGAISDVTVLRFANADTARPAPAPIDLASPLTGRWDGVLQVANGDRPAVLVCHPHTDKVLDGYLYITGMDMGQFQGGIWAADSLNFEIEGFQYHAYIDSTTMTIKRSGRGVNQLMALRFVGADTTRPEIQPGGVHFP